MLLDRQGGCMKEHCPKYQYVKIATYLSSDPYMAPLDYCIEVYQAVTLSNNHHDGGLSQPLRVDDCIIIAR